MASLDKKNKKPASKGPPDNMPKATDVEKLDLEIAVKMGTKLMREAGGLDTLDKAITESGDPVQVISKFLVQLIMQIKESIEAQGVELSPSIVLGQGGWVFQMLDLIEEELGMPRDFSNQVFGDVMETFKAMAQQPEEGGPPQEGGQPPMEQGAPPPGGGQPMPASGPTGNAPMAMPPEQGMM